MGLEDDCALEGAALSGSQKSGHEALIKYTTTEQFRRRSSHGCRKSVAKSDSNESLSNGTSDSDAGDSPAGSGSPVGTCLADDSSLIDLVEPTSKILS